MIKGDFDDEDPLTQPGHGWVDVRDVADAHVLSLERKRQAGRESFCPLEALFDRIGVCTSSFSKHQCLVVRYAYIIEKRVADFSQ
jgi:hypothetical protein